jgi:hypothetical protein
MWQEMVVDRSELARSGVGYHLGWYRETDENYGRQQLGQPITGMKYVPRDPQKTNEGWCTVTSIFEKIRISAEKPPNSRLHLVTTSLSPTFHFFDIDTANREKPRVLYISCSKSWKILSVADKCTCECASVSAYLLYRDVHCYQLHIVTVQVNIKLLSQPPRREAFRLDPHAQSTKGNRRGLFQNKPYKENSFTSKDTDNFQLHTSIFSGKKNRYCPPSCTAYCHKVLTFWYRSFTIKF